MSAIRLRRNENKDGLEVRVDDESPQSVCPVELSIQRAATNHDYDRNGNLYVTVYMTADEAEQLGKAILAAVRDAREWKRS